MENKGEKSSGGVVCSRQGKMKAAKETNIKQFLK